MFRYIFVLISFLLCYTSSESNENAKVSLNLRSLLISNPNIDILVSFEHDSSAKILRNFENQRFNTDSEHAFQLFKSLKSNTAQSQRSVIRFLENKKQKDGTPYNYKSFWITNQILVKNATKTLINELSNLRDVTEITEDLEVIQGQDEIVSKNRRTGDIEAGISLIKAPEVWKLGYNGAGVTVGIIDSGVRGTHTILKNNFIREFGWYDSVGNSEVPVDTTGHGTHTLGIIVGTGGIGVAPGARWMACRAGGPISYYIDCAQFMCCPKGGLQNDCGPRPKIISNSWGMDLNTPSSIFDWVIKVWHVLKIIPVFSIGNHGPFCGTTLAPSDYNVISVGAVDDDNCQLQNSSMGPGRFNETFFKPEIMAPGEEIASAWHTGDDETEFRRGTSSAAPHVAGAIALLLHRNPLLTYSQIREILFTTANKTVTPIPMICNGVNPLDKTPNYAFGHGTIDILAAIMKQKSSSNISLANLPLTIMFTAVVVMVSLLYA